MDKYDSLKLENQLCFPLYAAAREVIKQYHTPLDNIDLTYTQYITMMVFWQEKCLSVKELGQKLYLDSGTLTPVLKSLEAKGFVTRSRSIDDERIVIASVTEKGMSLRDSALAVPQQVAGCIRLEPSEAMQLYKLLYKILDSFEKG